jgi:hypothetical protein
MFFARIVTTLGILAFSQLLMAQAPQPTAYTITSAVAGPDPGTVTVYRSGSMALVELNHPAKPEGTPGNRSLTLYDLKAMTSVSWDPGATPAACSAGRFSGDWGDPFAMTAELSASIAKGDLKPSGSEALNGIATKVYAGAIQGNSLKAWFDEKDGLVIRAIVGAAGAPPMTLVDVRKVSFTPPPASRFVLPAGCASVKPPLSAAEVIAAETGDSGDNFVNGIYGPGSKNSCSIVVRVVAAKSMAPITRRWQAAIDTTYNIDSPPAYSFGMGSDGTATFSGGGLHEITSQIHNDMLRIDNPPAYFNLSINVVQPGHGAGAGLIYRQCFAPVTMLYYVLKDPNDPGQGGDFLYAKFGKYASVPAKRR